MRRTIYITGITCLTCTLYKDYNLSITLCPPWRVIAYQTFEESFLLKQNTTRIRYETASKFDNIKKKHKNNIDQIYLYKNYTYIKFVYMSEV